MDAPNANAPTVSAPTVSAPAASAPAASTAAPATRTEEPGFALAPERNSADVLLRTTQQHHVQLSAMADLKANIIITASSIVLTVTLGRASDLAAIKYGAMALIAFTLLALLLAVMAVLPKYRPLKLTDGPLPKGFNLLFFGHFAEMSRERFLKEIASTLQVGGTVHETMAKDLYALGYYLAHYKYRYLRWSYVLFLCGFIVSSLIQFGYWLLQ